MFHFTTSLMQMCPELEFGDVEGIKFCNHEQHMSWTAMAIQFHAALLTCPNYLILDKWSRSRELKQKLNSTKWQV